MFKEELGKDIKKALIIAAGGGGDSVGAVHTYMLLRNENINPILGALPWERLSIDPCPGPVPVQCFRGIKKLKNCLYMVNSDTLVRRCGKKFKIQLCNVLSVIDDIGIVYDAYRPVRQIAEDLYEYCLEEGIDVVFASDSGGDILGNGSEPNLLSPLADSYTASILYELYRLGIPVIVGIFGPGCDGELTRDELMRKFAIIAEKGYYLFHIGLTPSISRLMLKILEKAHTEASKLPLDAYYGKFGVVSIRRGERKVTLDITCAGTYYIHIRGLVEVTDLPEIIRDSKSILDAKNIFNRHGILTELDIEYELLRRGLATSKITAEEFVSIIKYLKRKIRQDYSSSRYSS